MNENANTVSGWVYDFDAMDVEKEAMQEFLEGDYFSCERAFRWDDTPQGYDFWYRVWIGASEFDGDDLADMTQQYGSWRLRKAVGQLDAKPQESPLTLVPHGGPSNYYDMPFSSWVTTNDMMEYLAEHKWGKYGIHLKDIFKGLCRWGDKKGTDIVYDSKKIIYYGTRVLMMLVGKDKTRAYLQELLDDKQFGG